MLLIIGILGGLLAIGGNIPYVTDTLKRKTKPHRVSWGIFLLLNFIFLANQIAAGATQSVWLIVGFTVASAVIFALSFTYGVGGHTKLDIAVVAGSLLGVAVWIASGSPVASILANIFVAILAFVPTFRKAYLEPSSETQIKWLLGAIAALLSIISVGKLNYLVLLYPLFVFVIQASLFTLLVVRTKQLRLDRVTKKL